MTRAVLAGGALALVATAVVAVGCGGGDGTADGQAATGTGAAARQAAASPASCPEVTGSGTWGFEFRNETQEPITLEVPPGWACSGGDKGGYVGVSVPGTLTGVRIDPGQSVVRSLEYDGPPTYSPKARFDLAFRVGSAAAASGSIPILFGGRRDGGGLWGFGTLRTDGKWTCQFTHAVETPTGYRLSVLVDALGAKGITSRKTCADDPARIVIRPA